MTIEKERKTTFEPATERDDAAYLDFVTGTRAFTPVMDKKVFEDTEVAVEEYSKRTGHKPEGLLESFEAIDGVESLQARRRWRRTSQEMFWTGVINTYEKRRAELLAELDRADMSGPGSVEYDPNYPIPVGYRRDIHVQPGGYTDNPLAGYIYHYGTKCFYQGHNDFDDVQRRNVARCPEPADGQVKRVLSIGCGVGQSATAMKERWPSAEVWGTDIGMPMVRYSHKRAVDMGLDVHFKQELAEDSGFPDGYFDIVEALIVFHEIPPDRRIPTIAEVARILRPGGLFIVSDFGTKDMGATGRQDSPLGEISGYTDGKDNVEPYANAFTASNFKADLLKHFSSYDFPKGDGGGYSIPMRVATK